MEWVAEMIGTILNWVKDWWHSRPALTVKCGQARALGNNLGLAGSSYPFFYEVDCTIASNSTRSYEIDHMEIVSTWNGLKVAQLRQKAHSQQGTLSPWGKSTSYGFTWDEKKVWPSDRFKMARLDSETRKLIIEAPQASQGVGLRVRAVGTDGNSCGSDNQVVLP